MLEAPELWRHLVDFLRGPIARAERARRADREHVLERARGHVSRSAEVAAAWPIVLQALDHQGPPRGNLDVLIGALEGTNHCAGWDEVSIDHEPALSPRVELAFLRERVTCDAGELLVELRRVRASLSDDLA